ncbi:hypothetical protein BvCmsKSP066_02568 [Escherichia coli]|nr:hypothetical protein BvCmsKSP066_02568 [Escherichia coli]
MLTNSCHGTWFSPINKRQYGAPLTLTQLLQQLMVLFPDNPRVQEMVDNWQKSVRSRALPEEAMTGWNEGMTRLQQLAERLNRLDEQRGKYMTVSELKTEVFGIMQAFNWHTRFADQSCI